MSKKAGVDKETRRVALLLSGLVTTPEGDLEDYRKKRLGRGSAVPLEHLARARAVLIAVAAALQSDGDDDIAALEDLHRAVTKGRPPAPAASSPATTDEPSEDEPEEATPEPPTNDGPELDPPPTDEAEEAEEADDLVPRPPRVGEGPTDSTPALAPSESASPWANPMAALAASRPAPPKVSRPSSDPPPPAPAPVPPPPLVAPALAADTDDADDDDERHTERPASSSLAPDTTQDVRHPRAGETAAPPASVTAEAAAEIPKAPVLPFLESPRSPAAADGARGVSGGPWALPFAASPTARAPEVAAGPPRYPRAEPDDDDEPTMASIALRPGDRGAGPSDPTTSRDEDDTHPAEIGGAALAHMTIAGSTLSLTDYAALCAICGAFPAHLSDTYLRFGLRDHTERYALDEIWHARFAEQPEAQALYKSLFTQFRAWLTQYGRL